MMNFIFNVVLGSTLNSITLTFDSKDQAEAFFTMDTDGYLCSSQVSSEICFNWLDNNIASSFKKSNGKLLAYHDEQCFEKSFVRLTLEQLITFFGNITWSARYDLKEQYFDCMTNLSIDSFNYAGFTKTDYMQLTTDALDTADEERCFLNYIENSIHQYAKELEEQVINPLDDFYFSYIESVAGYKTVSEAYEELNTLLENLISISAVFENYADRYDELCEVI